MGRGDGLTTFRRLMRKKQGIHAHKATEYRGGHRPSIDGRYFAVKAPSARFAKVEGQLKRIGPGAFTSPLRPLDQEYRIPRGNEAGLIVVRGISMR